MQDCLRTDPQGENKPKTRYRETYRCPRYWGTYTPAYSTLV